MAKKKQKVERVANPDLHRAMHGLRSSSAASPHKDRRTRRARTRQDQLRSVLRDAA